MKNEKKTIDQSRNMISEVKQPLENKIKHKGPDALKEKLED